MIKLRIVKWEDNPELGFSGGSVVKNLPARQELQIQSLGQEDPLEKEMQSTPVFLPGESLVGYSPWGHNESDMTEQLTLSSVTFFTMPLLPQTG